MAAVRLINPEKMRSCNGGHTVQTSILTVWTNQVTSVYLVPPDILDYPTSTDMVVREGANVNLRCVAKGSPPPSIAWKREGGEPIILSTGEHGKLLCGLFIGVVNLTT